MRALRLVLLFCGIGALVVLVVQNDPRAILESIRRLSWRIAVVVTTPAVLVAVFDTLGWRYAFVEDRVPFSWLLPARAAGEAFNLATPTGAVGGEIVKAWLIRPQVSLVEGVSSVIVAKTTITIAQGLFLLVGIVLAWHVFVTGSALLLAMQALLVIEVIALGAFVVAQTRGLVAGTERFLRRLGLRRATAWARVAQVDDLLVSFYRTRPARLALSIGFHFLAWLLGSVESYLILRFLGFEVSLLAATVIEALGASIRFATFMIPGSLGALEGGFAAIFAALGLGSTAGVAFTLVRRIRELTWIAIGLIAFGAMRTVAGGVPAKLDADLP
jgi:glycosyltransferase 2 family protein